MHKINKFVDERGAMFNIRKIKADLAKEPWDDGNSVRRLWLGTIFNLTPSGKYYVPFANSNVVPCQTCEGGGCDDCDDCGSIEAAADQRWYDLWGGRFAERGLLLEHGEDNPCDLYAVEYKDNQDD